MGLCKWTEKQYLMRRICFIYLKYLYLMKCAASQNIRPCPGLNTGPPKGGEIRKGQLQPSFRPWLQWQLDKGSHLGSCLGAGWQIISDLRAGLNNTSHLPLQAPSMRPFSSCKTLNSESGSKNSK